MDWKKIALKTAKNFGKKERKRELENSFNFK